MKRNNKNSKLQSPNSKEIPIFKFKCSKPAFRNLNFGHLKLFGICRFFGICCLIIGICCLFGQRALSAQTEVVDKIVALVNSSVITQSDVKEAIEQYEKELASVKDSALRKKMKEEYNNDVINKLINEKLFRSELEKQKITITDEDIDQSIKRLLNKRQVTKQQLINQLSKEGHTFDEYKERLRQQLMNDKFLQQVIYPRIQISSYDLENYYQKNHKDFQGFDQIRFLEIFLTEESVPAGTKLADLPMKIVTQLRKGASFSSMVKKYSRGAFANKGGDSGLLKTSEMRPELLSLLLRLKPNTISDPIGINNGIFIFKVIERKGQKTRPFNQVKELVRQKYIQERIDDEMERYLMEVRGRSYVEIR